MADKKFSDYSNDATPADGDIVLFENAAATDSFNTTYAQLKTHLFSDVSVADNYADDVYLIEADFHYQADQIGSFSESSKRP